MHSPAENWKPVDGWPGYEVSDAGRIRSLDRTTTTSARGIRAARVGRVLATAVAPNGYEVVSMSKGGRRTTHTVHSLVAEAFIGPRPAGKHVDHINGVKTDNWASNLRYLTPAENTAAAIANGHGPHMNRPTTAA